MKQSAGISVMNFVLPPNGNETAMIVKKMVSEVPCRTKISNMTWRTEKIRFSLRICAV